METKITVQSCVLKKEGSKDGKSWKIFEITTDTGKKYDSFEEFSIGEHSVIVTPDTSGKSYNDKIAKPKENKFGGFAKKDYTFDKKRVALECAVSLVNSGKSDIKSIKELSENFYQYLNS